MASLSSEACVVGLGMFLFVSWLCVGVFCLFLGVLVLRSTSAKFTIHLYS
jgi:hypothetical protein